MADYPQYTDPTPDQALASTDYTTGAGQIDQQASLNEQTYAQNRAETIRSYQDTLDNLNFGLKQAGISARGQYSGRNLYNASGSLSGTGELVGTELTQPIVRQMTSAQLGHEQNLARLGTAEAQGRLNVATSKADLLKNVLANLRTGAVDTYNAALKAKKEEADAALEASKLPGGAIDTLKTTQDQQAKGRTLLYQKDLANAVKMYGNDAIIKIGNQKFLLSSTERAALAKAKKTAGTGTGTKPRTVAQAKTLVNTDINKAIQSGQIQTRAGGSGTITREQLLGALAEDYPEMSRPELAKLVYQSIPD